MSGDLGSKVAAVLPQPTDLEASLDVELDCLRQEAWLTACLPVDAGGQGWGTQSEGAMAAFDALRMLGRSDLSLARLFEGHMNAVKLVQLYGSTALKDAIWQEVTAGALLGVWGADDPSASVRLEVDGDRLSLSGAKRFASGLGSVRHAIIVAATDEGGQLVVIPADEPERADPSTWRMAGMRATRSGRYVVDGLTVPAMYRLGAPDDLLREPYFEGGIWRYCAAHLGGAEALYDVMRDHLCDLNRQSDPVQGRRIAKAAIAIETARLWLVRAATEIEMADAAPGKAALALLAREVTERCCRDVMDLTERALGMAAHEEGSRIDQLRRDLGLFLCQATPDAKLARANDALIARRVRPELL